MSAPKSHAGGGGPEQINLDDPRAVALWSRRFGITPEQLRRAVKQVGSSAGELARYLGKVVPLRRGTS